MQACAECIFFLTQRTLCFCKLLIYNVLQIEDVR